MSSIRQRTTTYAICPHCQRDAGAVDQLLGHDLSTAWYCHACGGRYSLIFTQDGGVTIAALDEREITTIDVLVLEPQAKPVYFVVKGMRFEGRDCNHDDEHDHKEFFYESHSCPTNWLQPVMIYHDGDADPHGLLRFVTHVDSASLPPDETYGPNDHDAALVALIESSQNTKVGES